ncbi:thioredoxin domain-containing protein [Curtobacterium sp. MCPF17_052]|uniref:thioredoxin domain-containing protein n=1 Tax=Curtobacterium sp. MCPF17_052 TaxID=2175655 RepID=UPI0024DF334F|nr:DUF255 domain-containing protein [Curtobacterium sp. MCPF17_052]WIB13364.1 DUF255 domain-containing protein [Curtobacterium sp. MCPF17_052]
MNDNRLGTAVSPYLRQHADNPVDWREWGADAFTEARERDVPVLVSIGYATCHWCHVMARESFSDPEIGAMLRQDFVAVKVDREERPDVDSSAMAAASAFTENLGWPLTVFMTPAAQVFYAGTYYPPQPVGEHPSFRQVTAAVLDAWRDRRHEVDANAAAIAGAIRQGAEADAAAAQAGQPDGGGAGLPSVEAIHGVVSDLERAEDATYGGFGGAPKFPNAPLLEFLGDVAADGDGAAGAAGALLTRALDAIAGSELTDVDGGVFRYATQRDWSVPPLRADALRQCGPARGGRTRASPRHRGLPPRHPPTSGRCLRRGAGQRVDHRRPACGRRVVPRTARRARPARGAAARRPGPDRVERPGDPRAGHRGQSRRGRRDDRPRAQRGGRRHRGTPPGRTRHGPVEHPARWVDRSADDRGPRPVRGGVARARPRDRRARVRRDRAHARGRRTVGCAGGRSGPRRCRDRDR